MTGYDLSEKLSYVFKKFREYCTEKGMSPDDTEWDIAMNYYPYNDFTID